MRWIIVAGILIDCTGGERIAWQADFVSLCDLQAYWNVQKRVGVVSHSPLGVAYHSIRNGDEQRQGTHSAAVWKRSNRCREVFSSDAADLPNDQLVLRENSLPR